METNKPMKALEAARGLGLEAGGCEVSAVGLKIPEGTTADAWVEYGGKILRAGALFQWVLADWAAYGEKQLGRLRDFSILNNLDYNYLCNLSWVAGSVAHSRRRELLSFGHHQEVAPLTPIEQARWLALAEQRGLTRGELRERIRAARKGEDAKESDGPELRSIGGKCDDLCAFLQGKAEEWWDEERRKIWRQRLKPIAEFYQKL